MKELENIKADQVEIHGQKQHEAHLSIGNVVMHKGHTMFEIDCETGNIVPASYESVNATLGGEVKRKIICNPNCLYVPCLNIKAARNKFAKYLLENLIPHK